MRIFIILCTFKILLTLGTATTSTVPKQEAFNNLVKKLLSIRTSTITFTASTTVTSFITTTVVRQPLPPITTTVTITSTSTTTSPVTTTATMLTTATTTATMLTTATATVTTTFTVTATTTAAYHQINSIEAEGKKPQIKIESAITQSVDLAKTIHNAANTIKSILSSPSANNPIQSGQTSVLSQNKIQELQEIQQLIEKIEQNSNKAVKLGEFILKVAEVVNEESGPASRNSLRGSVMIRSD